MVLAQYYNFVRFGHDGYRYIMETMAANAARARGPHRRDRASSASIGEKDEEQLPLVAFRLKGEHDGYDESDIAWQLGRPSAAGWCRRTRFRRMPRT